MCNSRHKGTSCGIRWMWSWRMEGALHTIAMASQWIRAEKTGRRRTTWIPTQGSAGGTNPHRLHFNKSDRWQVCYHLQTKIDQQKKHSPINMLRKQHKIKIMLYLHLISFDKEDPPMGPCRNILICVCTNPSSQSSSTCISSVYSHYIFPQISFLDFSTWLNMHRSTWKVNNQSIAIYSRYTNCSDLKEKGELSPPKKST